MPLHRHQPLACCKRAKARAPNQIRGLIDNVTPPKKAETALKTPKINGLKEVDCEY